MSSRFSAGRWTKCIIAFVVIEEKAGDGNA
jgi:hypothetical protein